MELLGVLSARQVGLHMQAAPSEQQQQPASSTTPGQHGHARWAVSSPPSSCSLPHHLAALIPSPPKVSAHAEHHHWHPRSLDCV